MSEQLEAFASVLYRDAPADSFIEVRQPGRGQEFFPVGDPAALRACIDRRARTLFNLYVGVLPRAWESGKADAIEAGQVLWADCDTPESVELLASFEPQPTMTVRTGTGGHLHAYWKLAAPVEPESIEAANKALVKLLGADPRATDRARVLRPPETFNYKGGEPRPVTLASLRVPESLTIEEIVGEAVAPARSRRQPNEGGVVIPFPGPELRGGGRRLTELTPPEYIGDLLARPIRPGKINCPLPGHEDRTPSFHVWPEVGGEGGGWHCFGCGRSSGEGTDGIFRFAAHMLEIPVPLSDADREAIAGALVDRWRDRLVGRAAS